MALQARTCVAARNAAIDAAVGTIGSSGKLRIYDGTQPTDADTALSSNTLLADLALSATAFASASSGSATANAITSDTSADATGTASFFSLLTSANVRKIDGSVGTSGANLNLNTVSIVAGATVAVTSLTVTMAV